MTRTTLTNLARATRYPAQPGGARRLALRTAAALAAGALSLSLASCGFEAQTLQPYTPAEGVNLTVGSEDPEGPGVKLRNILIIANPVTGEGILSAAIVAGKGDKLVAVTGQMLDPDGEAAAGTGELKFDLGDPVELPGRTLVVLTDGRAIAVTGAPLKPGFTAELDLVFDKAGVATVTVPVVNGDKADYVTVSPSPAESAPGASASPGSSPSASPTA